MDADNLPVPGSNYKIINNPPHRSPPTLCIGGAVMNAAMRIARTGTDAAIVIAATENAPTADGFKDF